MARANDYSTVAGESEARLTLEVLELGAMQEEMAAMREQQGV